MARIERKKRGVPSSRKGSTISILRGVTVSAVESGIAYAALNVGYAMNDGDPFFYAVGKDGVPITFNNIYKEYGSWDEIPSVVGEYDTQEVHLGDITRIKSFLNIVNLYETPVEFQCVSADGVARYAIPYYVKHPPLATNEILSDMVNEYFPKKIPEIPQEIFYQQSSKMIQQEFFGTSKFIPWGRESPQFQEGVYVQ